MFSTPIIFTTQIVPMQGVGTILFKAEYRIEEGGKSEGYNQTSGFFRAGAGGPGGQFSADDEDGDVVIIRFLLNPVVKIVFKVFE